MRIRYFGHSAFLIENLLIDPFLTGNPHSKSRVEDITCDIICITHDHQDHLGDAFEIAGRNNAVIVAIHEIAELALSKGIEAEGMNIGGTLRVKGWDIKMVPALHSSGMGTPAGFVLHNLKSGKRIYHAGDTGLFSDMRLIGEEGIDIAMLPVGDRYTMGIKDALRAVEYIRPKIVIPMHYGTFPVLKDNVQDFRTDLAEVEIFGFGEEKSLE